MRDWHIAELADQLLEDTSSSYYLWLMRQGDRRRSYLRWLPPEYTRRDFLEMSISNFDHSRIYRGE